MAIASLVILLLGGTLGMMMLTGLGFVDALYFAVITISTVGFGEVAPIETPSEKLFVIGLILSAVAITAWAVGSAAELLFSESFWAYLGRQRMQKRIDALSGHTIVCGYGRMGRRVVRELEDEGRSWVVIDSKEAIVSEVQSEGGLAVLGDATHDDSLIPAGVERARSLITVTREDAANIVVILSARALCPTLTIAARAEDLDGVRKMYRAGATYVLAHHDTGAMHLSLGVTHPVVEKMLSLLIPRYGDPSMGQLVITETCTLRDQTLAALETRSAGALVLAVWRDGKPILPPRPEEPLRIGDVLVLVGSSAALLELRERTGAAEYEAEMIHRQGVEELVRS